MKKEHSFKLKIIGRIVIFFIIAFISSFMLPVVQFTSYSNFKTGHIAPETLISPFDFEILKSESDIVRERDIVRSKIIPTFVYTDTINIFLYRNYILLPGDLSSVNNAYNDFYKYQQKKYNRIYESDSLGGDTVFNNYKKNIKKLELQFYTKYNISAKDLDKNLLAEKANYTRIKDYLYRNRFMKLLNIDKSLIPNQRLGKIRLVSNKNSVRPLSDCVDPTEKKERDIVFLRTSITTDLNNDTLLFWHNIINQFSKPNVIFNKELTEEEINLRQNDLPIAKGLVKKGEEIVEKGKIISENTKDKLFSLEKKEQERLSEEHSEISGFFKLYSIRGIFGNLLLTMFPFMLLYIILFYNRKTIFFNLKKLVLLLLLILIELAMVFFCQKYLSFYNEFLVFLPTTSMLLAIFFDTRVAFFCTVITALLSTLIMRNDFAFFYVSVIVGIFSIYTVSRIRDRFSLFFRPFIFIMASLTVIAIAQNFHSAGNKEILLNNLLFSAISSFIAPVLTFALVALIEHYFKLPTDISLLELSDMTNPLLKKLQIEAPATYHHSIVIGNLAEAAAEAIFANSLLARVGAYYHDIGKTFKPEYFIENQQNKINKHDKLPPNMSAIILAAHVREGLKLAKENKLPQILCDFIAMHHGTSRMEFFYYKALELAKETGEEVDESIYRYPGPKPNSKETAIVMIADIVEARCRTIDKPDYDTYRIAINEIIQKKFQEGELDDCDLKLRDLAKIREAMLPVIIGMYHSRIKYPDQINRENKVEMKKVDALPNDFPSEHLNS